MRLEGKVAIVSGTGPNIGQEIAKRLSTEGASIVCTDYLEHNALQAAKLIKQAGGEAIGLQVDIRHKEQIQGMMDKVIDEYGRIDIVVNNAAVAVNKGTLEVSDEEWLNCVQINLTGTFNSCRLAAKHMVDLGIKGSIINIASTSGHRGRENAIAYCSTKAGVLNMTRAMAMDLAKHGIRVNSVSPTRTGLPVGVDKLDGDRPAPEIPLGRTGKPHEQANAVLFLASEESSFVTGFDLRVDGGALATWGVQEYKG